MASLRESAGDWLRFLDDIDRLRRDLRCSNSMAWFRGHSDSRWTLRPSLFRHGIANDPDDGPEIRRRQNGIEVLKSRWQDLLREKTGLKRRQQPPSATAGALQQQDADVPRLYHATTALANQTRAQLAEAKRDLLKFRAPVNGERELFDEYIFRSGKAASANSWEVLAEMRHFGVPTRLLDWTDRLDIALYFALERFRSEPLDGNVPAPCIWVLNPYNLARRVASRTAVLHLALDSTHDYYRLLLQERRWPYDAPVPTYPPAPIERVRAQRGYFTVFGNCKDDMETQLAQGFNCLGKVTIPPNAATFCLDYLSRVQGLSPYEVYRDLDSLGRELVERLRRIQLQ